MPIRDLAILLVLCSAICGCGGTGTNQPTPPADQGRPSREKVASDGKVAPAGMSYTVEESDGQFTVVIHNSPLGKYEYPVPNLNGIYIKSTDDKKHQVSVSAFQGKVESVKWNETVVPPKKDGAN